jgi:hypothetical protein
VIAYSGGANLNPFPDRQDLLLTKASVVWRLERCANNRHPTGYNHCIIMITGPVGRITRSRSQLHLRAPRHRVGCAPVCRRGASRPPPTRSDAPSVVRHGYSVGDLHP